MVGIVDYTTYTPRFRLRRDLIADQWNVKSIGGTKALANFDEDALTLAYEPAFELVERNRAGQPVDALYFASTTAPHWQRLSSSFIAAACDLPDELETTDFAGSLRAGTSAFRAALNAVAAGARSRVVVTAADTREASPGSPDEQLFGDGSAAVLVGSEGLIAELVAQGSRSDDFLDEWRRDRDRYVGNFRSRYSTERGYEFNVVAAARQVMDLAGVTPADLARVALSSPDGVAQLAAAQKIGFTPGQLMDIPLKDRGVTGVAQPLQLLCSMLEVAEPGQLVLAVSHGDGADAFLFRVLSSHRKRSPQPSINDLEISSYTLHLRMRDYTRSGPEEGVAISNVMFEKEERQNVRLHATRCLRCETVQFPLTEVCVSCHNREGMAEVPMARRGTVFTFTRDYLYDSLNPPTATVVIDMEDGARFYCQITDGDAEKVSIGQQVALTLRRFKEGGGLHHYYWKGRPL